MSAALFVLLAAMARPAGAAFSRDDAGTSTGQFLKLPIDARGAAMGGAMGAAASDLAALHWNPAGLSSLASRQAMASYIPYLQGAGYGFIGFAQPLELLLSRRPRRELQPTGLGTLAFGFTYFNAGALQEADNTGQKGRSFSPTDIAMTGGWGGSVSRHLDAGVAVKIIRSQIQESAATAAADAGMRLRFRLGPVPYALSASIHNTFGQLKYRTEADPLPVTARFGFSAELLPKPLLTVAFDTVARRDNQTYPCLGGELVIPIERRVAIAGRVGFNGGTTPGQLEGSSGFTFGGGIALFKATVDYSWQPFGNLGTTHRFTLSYRF